MQKNFIRLAFGTALFLLIPLALTIRDGNVSNVGWNWSPGDFVFGFVLIFGIGSAFIYIASKATNTAYRVAAGLALLTTFALIWIDAAVGIIGEDNGSNLIYFAALIIGFIFVFISRLEPRGMARAMFVTAFAVFLVPVAALLIGIPDWSPGVAQVFMLTGVFVVLYIGSGLLFRRSSA